MATAFSKDFAKRMVKRTMECKRSIERQRYGYKQLDRVYRRAMRRCSERGCWCEEWSRLAAANADWYVALRGLTFCRLDSISRGEHYL